MLVKQAECYLTGTLTSPPAQCLQTLMGAEVVSTAHVRSGSLTAQLCTHYRGRGVIPRGYLFVYKTSGMVKEALVQWLTAGGGYVHPHLDLMADLGDGERGVVVTQAIQEREQLAVVPLRLCLHTPTLAQQASPFHWHVYAAKS